MRAVSITASGRGGLPGSDHGQDQCRRPGVEYAGDQCAEVRRQVAGVSDRMLWQTLQRLEDHGLVTRTPHPTVARRVDYGLTALGRPIAERVGDLIDTIYEQLPGIVAHQRALAAEAAPDDSPEAPTPSQTIRTRPKH
ncbi:winged helix-turn-helix transcriptional regulator [Streptomyces sp. NPDC096132]|uniref:winged helix-turn-helix transcriptional regulator n=1 Tax=Streptomyces sp. NPDC096132 TaxID=3366075 RepID=UPI003809713F